MRETKRQMRQLQRAWGFPCARLGPQPRHQREAPMFLEVGVRREPVICLQQLQHGLAVLRTPHDLLVEGARLLCDETRHVEPWSRPALCLKGAGGVQGPAHAVQCPSIASRKLRSVPGRLAWQEAPPPALQTSMPKLAGSARAQHISEAPHSTRHRAAQTTGTTRSLARNASPFSAVSKSTKAHPPFKPSFRPPASTTQPCKMTAAWLVAKTSLRSKAPRLHLPAGPTGYGSTAASRRR